MAKKDSLWQQGLLRRLGIGDLVDDQANTTLGDDVRDAVANLDVDNLCQAPKLCLKVRTLASCNLGSCRLAGQRDILP